MHQLYDLQSDFNFEFRTLLYLNYMKYAITYFPLTSPEIYFIQMKVGHSFNTLNIIHSEECKSNKHAHANKHEKIKSVVMLLISF